MKSDVGAAIVPPLGLSVRQLEVVEKGIVPLVFTFWTVMVPE
jgi:hypothetical protein